MEAVLLSVHVLAGIVFVGGSAVAASLFPRYAPVAVSAPGPDGSAGPDGVAGADGAAGPDGAADPDGAAGSGGAPGERNRAVAVALHRITRVYGVLGIIVPIVGIVLAVVQGRTGEIWLTIAMLLTAAAGALLALRIYPGQSEALATPDDGARLRGLAMQAGVYNLLWAVVVILMIVRPGAYP
ncbi:hypothetical protein [Sphaerisporangium sp. TRM90804]|uniref:hypothetical protein n=1 Tax=Sphaerisporangium sp. TRM90804 TaxID=3031113 RepID=UPI002449B30C|nr:hypothetical protein [Sphaerisporangium sp. TRM90804]MDH2429669.1 hypothetical protein [Sphaerisporangium sp. TRM90804]